MTVAVEALPLPPLRLGESPFWWPEQAALYCCDIAGRALHRYVPADGSHARWDFDSELACCAPVADGTLLVALRSGIERFDPRSGRRTPLQAPPYDPATQRFNDGKADPQGRLWVGTVCEPREPPLATLYRCAAGRLEAVVPGLSTCNGIAFSPDARTVYWSDTHAHRIHAADFDLASGAIANRRVFATFAPKPAGGALEGYGGRPDGAAIDAEGAYWAAMYEGARLVRLAPDGRQLAELLLPVRCPTMPCFGGADLRTLYVTTAREQRPAAELAAEPLAGRILALRVDVPGLPVAFARV